METILKGRINIPAGTFLHYALRNFHDKPLKIKRITLRPEPSELAVVQDVKVGRNSQAVCAGEFKASILNRLPAICVDNVPTGVDVGLMISGPLHGECEILLGPVDSTVRRSLFPVGATQVSGQLVEIATTLALFEAIEKGTVALIVQKSPNIPDYQEAPTRVAFKTKIRNGRVMTEKPIHFNVTERFSVSFEGDDGSKFVNSDVVAILEEAR
jgi:hypothetical protein